MLLGIDLGTTNVKAVVAELDGRALGTGSVPVPLLHLPNGGVEQSIDEIWSATRGAIRAAVKQLDPSQIHAIGISAQGGALQMLDPAGHPRGRVISWLDSRGHAADAELNARLTVQWFLERTFHGGSGLAVGQLARLRREQPGWFGPDGRVGFVGDIIVSKLCGRAAHDGTSCALTLLYNPARRDYDHELLAELGLRAPQLPDLVFPPVAAGPLDGTVAAELGLPTGIPVSPAIHDQYAAALGSAVVHPGDVMFGAGTAWVLLGVTERLRPPVTDQAFVCHHLADDLYGQIVSLRNGGSAFQWGLRLFGWEALPFPEIDKRLSTVPPGSCGLICRPLLGAFGATGLVPGVKGDLRGLQFEHGPTHVLRSIVEGLACELRRHLEFMEHAGMPARRLIMTGGAAAGAVTPQVVSDVTGLPVHCLGGEGSVRGAVVLARGLLEKKANLAQLAEAMVPAGRLVKPGPAQANYEQVYATYLSGLPVARPRSSI